MPCRAPADVQGRSSHGEESIYCVSERIKQRQGSLVLAPSETKTDALEPVLKPPPSMEYVIDLSGLWLSFPRSLPQFLTGTVQSPHSPTRLFIHIITSVIKDASCNVPLPRSEPSRVAERYDSRDLRSRKVLA